LDSGASLGGWLQQRRKALDLTQEALAQRVGCSVATIRKIEADERRPSRQIAELLAQALDIPSADRPAFIKVARGERATDRLAAVPSLTPPHRSNYLPIPPTPLVGREPELAEIARLLDNPLCRLLTLVGPGGIGKTRLALQAASNHRAALADGAVFVSLASISSPEFIVSAMADALRFTLQGPADPKAQLLSHLREKEILLALDNFEHLLDGANLLAEILEHAPEVKLLVTSREALSVQAEWVFEVHGLPVPDSLQAGDLETNSAVRLFVQSAQRTRVGFNLMAADQLAAARICQLVDGMPLGIELAAAWIRVLSCAGIAREIERGLDFLATTRRDVPARHRSLRAVFDHSWNLLDDDERHVLMKLSVFRGGFTREAAEQVAGAGLTLLSALVAKSVVRPAVEEWFDMHELVRQYAKAHLQDEPEARRAHATYYLALAEKAMPQLIGPQQAAWLNRLEQEHDNIRAALDWLLSADDQDSTWRMEVALRLSRALTRFWQGRHVIEGRRWLERSLTAETSLARRAPTDVRARALGTAGRLAAIQGDFEPAKAFAREGLALFRESQDTDGVADALDFLGDVVWLQGEFAQADTLYTESLDLRRVLGMKNKIAWSLSSVGNAAVEGGDYARARRCYEDSLALCRELGDERSTALALYGLGLVAVEQNDSQQASLRLIQAVALFDKLRNDLDIAFCLECLALVAVSQSRAAQAARLWGASEMLLERLNISLFGNYILRRERGVSAARAQLDEAAFMAAWAQGRAMSREQTIAYAMASGGD
jgi:predicted ATPase/transcriptional regulator with XRE-family HTH domain